MSEHPAVRRHDDGPAPGNSSIQKMLAWLDAAGAELVEELAELPRDEALAEIRRMFPRTAEVLGRIWERTP
jgi:hypothetical protein